MKITHYTTIPATRFSGELVKNVEGCVAIGKADGADNFCMRVFRIEPQGFTPKHSHSWEHEVFIYTGDGKVFCDGKWHKISSGYIVFIPPGKEHQFINESSEDLVFICLIPAGINEL